MSKKDIGICPCCQQERPYPTEAGSWKYRQNGSGGWFEVIVSDDDPEGLTMTHIGDDEPSWWPNNAEWEKIEDISEYAKVMNSYAKKAEELGQVSDDPKDAWLYIDDVWWQNPHYTGEDVIRPELKNEPEL